MNRLNRNLAGEFHELGEDMDSSPDLDHSTAFPAFPIPIVPMPNYQFPNPPVPIPAAPDPATLTPTAAPLLVGVLGPQVQFCSITTPGADGSGWTPEWPDARPMIGYSSISPGLSYGSTSGFTQSPTLSPIPTPW